MPPWNRLRSWKPALFALPLLLLAAAGAAHLSAPKPAVFIDLTPPASAPPLVSLPDPPRQNEPWTPPATTLPPEFLAAAKTLFRQGFADPRGGEYRTITLEISNVWGQATPPTQTHGWVLPHRDGDARTFVVCWNGQVYPLLSAGPPADLQADAAAAARAAATPAGRTLDETDTIAATSFFPLKACLLLRLGKVELAKQIWMAQTPDARSGDPYLRLAGDWSWGLLRRCLDARLQSNDPLALFLMRRLTRIRAHIEGEAAERHLPHAENPAYGLPVTLHSYLPFLDSLPDLLADQEQRTPLVKHTPALALGEKAFPSKSAYIAALIGDLDQVSPNAWGGGLPMVAQESIVQALAAQGDAAVEPLIHTVAADRRLARLVAIEPFSRSVFVTRVSQIALSTIILILQVSSFGADASADNGPAKTAALQAYWDEYKSLPPAERWYRTLADDRATPQEWLEAADAIVRPSNMTFYDYRAYSLRSTPGVIFPLRGEPLRARYGTTISQLIARRVPQIAAVDWQHPWLSVMNAHNAALMALDAARWDARTTLPALRAQAAYLGHLKMNEYGSDPQLDADQAAIALARRQGGDPQALADYTAWLLAQTPETAGFGGTAAFEPLWRFPHDPAVTAAAARLFNGPPSPWKPFLQKRQNTSDFGELLQSPLLGLEAFRRSFFVALRDKTEIGTLTLNGQGWWSADLPGLEGSGSLLENDNSIDRFRPKKVQAFTVRRCDVYAWRLSHLAGMPRFALYWSQAKRDQVVAQAAARLRRYGPRFEYQESTDFLWDQNAQFQHSHFLAYLWSMTGSPLAHLAFPRRDRPATLAEAAQGETIFSLDGLGERRVVPLPRWPLPARWVTDHRYPQRSDYFGKPAVTYQQDGLVWQAEEVRRNGKWERFYGFVGPHDIVRVPAEQIEFPADEPNPFAWQPLSHGIEGKTSLRDQRQRWKIGEALPVTLTLRNRSGLPESIPADWLRDEADGPKLREGVTLRLYFVPPPEQHVTWIEESAPTLPRIRQATFPPTEATQTLASTEEKQALQFDLRGWYDLSRPGWYLLYLDIDDKRTGLRGKQSVGVLFQLTEKGRAFHR